MSISNFVSIQRKPNHPGEMLREDFIPDYDLTVARLAERLSAVGERVIARAPFCQS